METWKLLDGETEVRDEGTAVRFRVYCRPPCEPTRLLRCYGEAEPNDLLVGVLEPQNGRLTLERRISRESLRQAGIRELPKKFYLSDGGARDRGEPSKENAAGAAPAAKAVPADAAGDPPVAEAGTAETADASPAADAVPGGTENIVPVEEAVPAGAVRAEPVAETVPPGIGDIEPVVGIVPSGAGDVKSAAGTVPSETGNAKPVKGTVPAGAVDVSPVAKTAPVDCKDMTGTPVSEPAPAGTAIASKKASQTSADVIPDLCDKPNQNAGGTIPQNTSKREGLNVQPSPTPRGAGMNKAANPDVQPSTAPDRTSEAVSSGAQLSPAPQGKGASSGVQPSPAPGGVNKAASARVQPRPAPHSMSMSETAGSGAQASPAPRGAGRRSTQAPHTEFLRFPVDGCPLPASSQPAAASAPAFSASHSRDAVPFKTGDALLDAVIARGEATCEPSPNGLRITCQFSPKQPFALAFIATLCRVEHRIAILDWENV